MPNVGKRTFSRRSYRKRARGTKRTRRLIKSVVNRTLRSKIEVKSNMIVGTEQSLNTLTKGTFVDLFGAIAQGVGSHERIGQHIKVTGIQVKLILNNNSTNTMFVRSGIVRGVDRGAATSTSQWFMSTTNTDISVSSLTNLAAIQRPFSPHMVVPVYNRVNKLSAYTGEAAESFKSYTKFIKFPRGMRVNYNNAGVGTGVTNPCLIFFAFASEAPEDVGAGLVVEATYQIRIFYTDA